MLPKLCSSANPPHPPLGYVNVQLAVYISARNPWAHDRQAYVPHPPPRRHDTTLAVDALPSEGPYPLIVEIHRRIGLPICTNNFITPIYEATITLPIQHKRSIGMVVLGLPYTHHTIRLRVFIQHRQGLVDQLPIHHHRVTQQNNDVRKFWYLRRNLEDGVLDNVPMMGRIPTQVVWSPQDCIRPRP